MVAVPTHERQRTSTNPRGAQRRSAAIGSRMTTFPDHGMESGAILEALARRRPETPDGRDTFADRWLNDRGLLVNDDVMEVAQAAYLAFFTKNASDPAVAPLERDVIDMTIDLL